MDFGFRFFTNGSSSNSSTESIGLLGNANNDVETSGSLACLFDAEGSDSFGGKDIFGTVDCSNMNESFFANASSDVETSGSLACVGSGIDFGGVSCGGGDFGGAACASVGGDSGGSCGGGSFSSVC